MEALADKINKFNKTSWHFDINNNYTSTNGEIS